MTASRAPGWYLPAADVGAGAAELLRLSHVALPEVKVALPRAGAVVVGPAIPPPRPLDGTLGEAGRRGFVVRLLGLACFLRSRGLGLDGAALTGLGSRPGRPAVPWLPGPAAPAWRALPPALVAAAGALRLSGRALEGGTVAELWVEVEAALDDGADAVTASFVRGALRARDGEETPDALLASLLSDPAVPGDVRPDLLGLVFPAGPRSAAVQAPISCAAGPAGLTVARGVARRSPAERGFVEAFPADPLAEGSTLAGVARLLHDTPIGGWIARLANGDSPDPPEVAPLTFVAVDPLSWDERSRRVFDSELGRCGAIERIEVRGAGLRPWEERHVLSAKVTADEVPSLVWLPFRSTAEAGACWRELARMADGDLARLIARSREHAEGPGAAARGTGRRGTSASTKGLLEAAALLSGGFDEVELALAASVPREGARSAIENGLLEGRLVPRGSGVGFRDARDRRALAARLSARAVADICRRLEAGGTGEPRLSAPRLARGTPADVGAAREAFARAVRADDLLAARDLLDAAPASDPDLGDPLGAARALFASGARERAREAARRVTAGDAERLADPERERAARLLARLGEVETALRLAATGGVAARGLSRAEVLLAARRDGDAALCLDGVEPSSADEEVRHLLLRAELADRRQDLAAAEACLARVADRLAETGPERRARAAVTAGRLALDLGRPGEAVGFFASARDGATDPPARADAAFDLSTALLESSRLAEARAALDEAFSVYSATGEDERYLTALSQRALLSLRAGDAQAARRDLERVLAHDTAPGREHQLLFAIPIWQELALADGDLEEAETAFAAARRALVPEAVHPAHREILVREAHRLLLAREPRRARSLLLEVASLPDARSRIEPLRERLLASAGVDLGERGSAPPSLGPEELLLFAAEERLAAGEPPGRAARERLGSMPPVAAAARLLEWRLRFAGAFDVPAVAPLRVLGERKARAAGLDGAAVLLAAPAAGLPPRPSVPRPGLVALDPPMRAALDLVARVAPRKLPVLVLGESGTGKEEVAREVHRLSGRTGALIPINMAAVPETLAEAELFGHVRGAFTGADRERVGVLEASSGGTLFLDEIGDLPLGLQAKLLRVLQEHEVRRLGETRTRKVDLRIVAATHRDLRALVDGGLFRLDLYHRLAVAVVTLPPLRERPLDLVALTDRALGGTATLAPSARRALLAYSWPGNVRELHSVLEAARAFAAPGAVIGLAHLPDRIRPAGEASSSAGGKGRYAAAVAEARRRIIGEALAACGGNRTNAARWLGLSRQSLAYEMRRLGLS